MPQKIYEPITTKQLLNRVREEIMPFDWSLNPYRGCAHGCSFCYARAFQGFIGLSSEDEFQNRILLKENAAEALEAQLSRVARKCGGDLDALADKVGLVAVGTATDPYQPVEAKAGLTRACLKVLCKYGIPITITTRSPLILRDLDILEDMRITSVNISINSLRPDITRKLEPAAPFPMKRLEALERLAERGIPSGVFIAPIIPFLTDSTRDLEALIAQAQAHGASFAAASLLRLSPDVKAWFYHTLERFFPHLQQAFQSLYPSTYAQSAYSNRLMATVGRLTAKYGLAPELPRHSRQIMRQIPQSRAQEPSCPAQLAFTFD